MKFGDLLFEAGNFKEWCAKNGLKPSCAESLKTYLEEKKNEP